MGLRHTVFESPSPRPRPHEPPSHAPHLQSHHLTLSSSRSFGRGPKNKTADWAFGITRIFWNNPIKLRGQFRVRNNESANFLYSFRFIWRKAIRKILAFLFQPRRNKRSFVSPTLSKFDPESSLILNVFFITSHFFRFPFPPTLFSAIPFFFYFGGKLNDWELGKEKKNESEPRKPKFFYFHDSVPYSGGIGPDRVAIAFM